MLFPVTYFHPADCVLLPNSSSTQLSTFILPPPLFHMLLPASVLDAALHFLFPSSVRLLPASFRRPACYFHPTSYSHSVYCILTRPSTFCFHPPRYFDFLISHSMLLPFTYFPSSMQHPTSILHAASHTASVCFLLPTSVLHAASCFHPPSCSHVPPTHCFLLPTSTLHPASYSHPPCCFQIPSSILQVASS